MVNCLWFCFLCWHPCSWQHFSLHLHPRSRHRHFICFEDDSALILCSTAHRSHEELSENVVLLSSLSMLGKLLESERNYRGPGRFFQIPLSWPVFFVDLCAALWGRRLCAQCTTLLPVSCPVTAHIFCAMIALFCRFQSELGNFLCLANFNCISTKQLWLLQ